MEKELDTHMTLGINGLGRIGKLLLWNSVQRKYFQKIVVNIGRPAGTSFTDLAHYVERDSTYGRLHTFLHGNAADPVITDLDETKKTMCLDGVAVQFLQSARNPKDIAWAEHDARVVADTTGAFLDPVKDPDAPGGSVRGHLLAGADKVVVSAPFKMKNAGEEIPEDAVTTVMGINDSAYDPRRHRIVSNASCTTTCLAHMFRPLLNAFGADRILTASMATVHAATGSQQVLDRLPGAKKADLRKNRSILNNIILTSTGAAKALIQVIPEMSTIGFLAESVRIPTSAGSLIILVVNIQESMEGGFITRERINGIYQEAQKSNPIEISDIFRKAKRVFRHPGMAPGRGGHRGPRNPHPHRGSGHQPQTGPGTGPENHRGPERSRGAGAHDQGRDLRLV